MKWVEVEFQGQKCQVPVVKYQGKMWFHWSGESHVLDVSGGGRRSSSEPTVGKLGVTLAPMPGKVTCVNVKVGDTVEIGQPLAVMEAMKMEYTLESDIVGKVSEVGASVGQQVALGDVLVKVVKL